MTATGGPKPSYNITNGGSHASWRQSMRVSLPSNHWATSEDLYDKLDKVYNFDPFDPCPYNCDLNKFNGLTVPWAETTFVNPPYDFSSKVAFVLKALEESKLGKTVVLLLPVSTSTSLYHNVIKLNAVSIDFIQGRLLFEGINNKGQWCNPYKGITSPGTIALREAAEGLKKVKSAGAHDSMIVVFGRQ